MTRTQAERIARFVESHHVLCALVPTGPESWAIEIYSTVRLQSGEWTTETERAYRMNDARAILGY
ncbi:MAG: hypothetical protein KGJ38_08330 [Burkholderiaceae bacterium]|nr:hypothetical protein [Burkholderiaceae bacterium]